MLLCTYLSEMQQSAVSSRLPAQDIMLVND